MNHPHIAIVGAGIIGLTNAIHLLEHGFSVTLYSKHPPLRTNSDAAVATWFAPDQAKPILQKLCLNSLPYFKKMATSDAAGVSTIPILYFFENEKAYLKSIFAKKFMVETLKTTRYFLNDSPYSEQFPYQVMSQVPLIDIAIYRPYLLNRFFALNGHLKIKTIFSLQNLLSKYDIVINCSGWETTKLSPDPLVHPVRGQIELLKNNPLPQLPDKLSINIKELGIYVVYKPFSHQWVCGTTYKIDDISRRPRKSERMEILNKITPFYPDIVTFPTQSRTGIRCGRPDARIEAIYDNYDQPKKMLLHCYGHAGSGVSASWGSAEQVLEQCENFLKITKPVYTLST